MARFFFNFVMGLTYMLIFIEAAKDAISKNFFGVVAMMFVLIVVLALHATIEEGCNNG